MVVFLAVILIPDFNLVLRILVVLAGVLMIEAGVWKLTGPFMPSDRRYVELRDEVDRFIDRVRVLNEAAVEARGTSAEEEWDRYEEVLEEMRASVSRMAGLAGKPVGEDPTRRPDRGGGAG